MGRRNLKRETGLLVTRMVTVTRMHVEKKRVGGGELPVVACFGCPPVKIPTVSEGVAAVHRLVEVSYSSSCTNVRRLGSPRESIDRKICLSID